MIIVLKSEVSDEQVADVERRITAMGYRPHTIRGQLRTVIGAIGDDRGKERLRSLESLETVESVTPILQPFKLASREVHHGNSIVRIGGVAVGGPKVVVMAGPCSVESREQVLEVAAKVKAAGAAVLRGARAVRASHGPEWLLFRLLATFGQRSEEALEADQVNANSLGITMMSLGSADPFPADGPTPEDIVASCPKVLAD